MTPTQEQHIAEFAEKAPVFLREFERLSKKSKEDNWKTKEEVKELLRNSRGKPCSDEKLRLLVNERKLIVNREPGRGIQLRYWLPSIKSYLNGE